MDELEAAHRAVGGAGRGRRTATQQVNDAYLVLVLAHFQRFCRDLHSEAAFFVANSMLPPAAQPLIQQALTRERQLDKVNPRPGAIGSDFGMFGLALWPALTANDARTAIRNQRLEQLATWRNAIAHQDFTFSVHEQETIDDTARTLAWIKVWRSSCDGLARGMDVVVGQHLTNLFGAAPW